MELDKLMMTSPAGTRDQVETNFDGFKRLFGKFINSSGPSVQWEKIEKLPQDAVRFLIDYLRSFYECKCLSVHLTKIFK